MTHFPEKKIISEYQPRDDRVLGLLDKGFKIAVIMKERKIQSR